MPLQLCQEDLHVQRVAKVVEEARDQLEDANVQLEVAAVPVHDDQRRQERQVGEDLEAKGDGQLEIVGGEVAVVVVDVARRPDRHPGRARRDAASLSRRTASR